MAKGEKKDVLRGKGLWDALEGKKEEITEIIPIEFGGIEGEVTVIFRDVDVVQEVSEEYEEKKTKKPIISIVTKRGKENIEVPSQDEKYKAFNDHPEAKEWEKKNQPIETEKRYRLAWEFIHPDERPGESPEDGVKILKDRLRFMDASNIVNAGFRLNDISDQLGKQKEGS
jgi:hypothetical protein